MGTTADKLNHLKTTKHLFKQALINKGVHVADTDTFRSYVDKLEEIKTEEDLTSELTEQANALTELEVIAYNLPDKGSSQEPILQDKEVTPTKETQIVTADEGFDGLNSTTVKPIPEEYIIPEGELEIKENNTYDVTNKKTVIVNVPNTGGGSGSGEYETINEMKLVDLTQNVINGWVMPTEEEYIEQEPQVNELITILSGGTI